ncbi:hypothetical protein WEI85_44020 [Actinomycetes bacterium KLBMP 9797]
MVAAVLVAVGIGYPLGRVRGAGALDGVWAEDGANFLHDAANKSVVDAVTTPLNGYWHLYARLLAEITTAFPVSAWAAVNGTLAALSTAGLALIVYVASSGHLRHPALRLLAAAPVVTQWASAGEVAANVATLQFPALYALFWVLLHVPARRAGMVAAPIFSGLVALSTTLVVALLPLALARAVLRRDRAGVLTLAALGLGTTVQLLGLATGRAQRGDLGEPRYEPVWILDQFAVLQVPVAYLGEIWIRGYQLLGQPLVRVNEHRALILLGWLVPLAALTLALLRRTRPGWLLAAVAALHALGIFGLQIALLGHVPGRYLVPSTLLLVTTAIALLRPWSWTSGFSWKGRNGLGAAPIVALASLLTVVSIANYRTTHIWRTPDVPGWRGQVVANREKCTADPTLPAVTFRSGPADKKAWGTFDLPCPRLR